MNKFCIVVYAILFSVCNVSCFAQQSVFRIAEHGDPRVAIVVAANASTAELTAANELSVHLGKVTNGSFPVYKSGLSPAGMPRILIGQSLETKRILGNIDWKTLKHDGITIQFVGNDLVLAGDAPRGSLYAVYTFLEEYVDCRWWTPESASMPHKPTLSVKKKNKTHIPPFMYREAYFTQVSSRNPEFATRLKLNGTSQAIPEKYGSHYTLLGFVHTADVFMPAAGYFEAHPEWFSLVNGKRVGGQAYGQLCLTNEEMKAEFIRNVLKSVDAEPYAGMVAIDQNDNLNYCQCEKCSAVAKEEGGQSGVMIRFVNSVADAISKKYPDFLVETLAYQYTRNAPKVTKPRDNVIVRLCSIEGDFASPLDSKKNSAFYRDLQDWKRISRHLYVWDYVVNFQNLSLTHPNWRVLGPNMRIFAKSNVVGMFSQGDTYNNDASFLHMKTWVLSRLMWDPNQDAYKLMREFASGYYGKAAPHLIQYLDTVCDAVEDSYTLQLGCFVGTYLDYMKQKDMDKANDLFDKAERSVADNAVLLRRVRIERLSLDQAWIHQTLLDRSRAGKQRNMDMQEIAENYIRMSQETGNDFIREGVKMSDSFYDEIRKLAVTPPLPPQPKAPTPKKHVEKPKPTAGFQSSQWIDVQDSKMFLYKPGVNSFIVKDDDASDGVAVRLPGEQADWAAQIHLDKTGLKAGKKATLYVSVKAKTKAQSGNAFTIGIIDVLSNKGIMMKNIKIEDIKGSGYFDYNLGTYKLEPKWYIFVAAPGDSSLVEEILVDRGFIIKDN